METMNYDKFTFYKANRKIYPAHVERIKKSIELLGYVKSNPILVNQEHEIIDGQHRFMACKELRIPIQYEYSNIEGNHAILALNEAQQHWKLSDYVHLHASMGVKFYQDVERFEEFHKVGLSNALMILSGSIGFSSKEVQQGKEYPIFSRHAEVLEFIFHAKQYISFWRNSKFVRSIIKIHHECSPKDIAKLKDKCMLFTPQLGHQDYLKMYENILNTSRKYKIRLT